MVSACFKYFREALSLDIYDINYYFSSESLNTLSHDPAALPRKGICNRSISYLVRLCKSISTLAKTENVVAPKDPLVFFVNAKNEQDSLQPVYQKTPKAYVVGYGAYYNRYPFFWAYLLSLLFVPVVAFKYIKSKGYQKKSFAYCYDYYLLPYGFYIIFRIWLNRVKPKAIILSNDLSQTNRVLVLAARAESIATFYIQHASVTENFPPLTVDFALLDGRDALNKYIAAGTTFAKLYLIGVPKLDSHIAQINTNKTIYTLGICTNPLDPISRIEELCVQIMMFNPLLSLIIRPHTSDRRIIKMKDMAKKLKINFSDSREELSFDFLKGVDSIIACDSNILLEAALIDVFPLYYDFSNNNFDWYGFVRNGLVKYFSSPCDISRYLHDISRNKPSVRLNAKPYCSTIGTKYDGRASDLASSLIQKLALYGKAGPEWMVIQDVSLNSYEILNN